MITIPLWFAAVVVVSFTVITTLLAVTAKDYRERNRSERLEIERDTINAYNRGIESGFRAITIMLEKRFNGSIKDENTDPK